MRLTRLVSAFAIAAVAFTACENTATSPTTPDAETTLRPAGHTSVMWKGFDWSVSDAVTAALDAGNVVLTRTGASEATLTIPGVPGVNVSGTPWLLFSWIDDATSQAGFDLFINFGSSDARISGGTLFTFAEGFGFERFGVPAIEFPLFCKGSVPAAIPFIPIPCSEGAGRVAGPHTLYIGQRADGTIDANFDGEWFSGTFLKDNGEAPFDFEEVMLRWRGGDSGDTATFLDFRAGNNHPGGGNMNACTKGGWAESGIFKNQGDCIQYANTGKTDSGKGKGKKK